MSDSGTRLWQRVQELFAAALDVPEEERDGFLREQCGGDEQLQAEVASLLASFPSGKEELERSPVAQGVGSSAPDLVVPGYELISEIHRGGQGIVYRALQLGTKREVALKFMLTGPFAGEAERRRFQREIELVSRLTHPGIVSVFDSGEAHGHRYFVMEYVDGLRLDEFVRDRNLGTDEILELAVRICTAVGFAHRRGIVHRDLKPSNILVAGDGEPRVLDFGLAKLHDGADDETIPLSMTGQVMGTLAYMSPEHAGGRPSELDARSDVYALAVILYELLAKKLPYALDQSLSQNLVTIQTAEPARLQTPDSKPTGEVVTIVHKALSKDKPRRYSDALTLGEDLQRYLRGEAIEAKRDSTLYVLRKRVRRYIVPLGIATALVGGLAIGVVVQTVGRPPPAVAGRLPPLSEGELYSREDLDSQIDGVNDLIRRGTDGAALIQDFLERFGPLEESQFARSIGDQRLHDLRKLKSLERFLAANPNHETIAVRRDAENNSRPLPDGTRTSGLVRGIIAAILESAQHGALPPAN